MSALPSTLDRIQQLSNERQHLWKLWRHQKPTDDQRERLRFIKRELSQLWNLHRCELAYAQKKRVFIEDRVRGDVFADYLERLNGERTLDDDWNDIGHVVALPAAPPAPPVWESASAPDIPAQANIDDIAVQVLREVLAELRTTAKNKFVAPKRPIRSGGAVHVYVSHLPA